MKLKTVAYHRLSENKTVVAIMSADEEADHPEWCRMSEYYTLASEKSRADELVRRFNAYDELAKAIRLIHPVLEAASESGFLDDLPGQLEGGYDQLNDACDAVTEAFELLKQEGQ